MKRGLLLALICAVGGSQAYGGQIAEADLAFDIASAPMALRGKTVPLSRANPSAGSRYYDARGLYSFMLPTGWETLVVRNGVSFVGHNQGYAISCMAGAGEYRSGLSTLAEMQVAPEHGLRDWVERQFDATTTITSRGTMKLGMIGLTVKTPVKLLVWHGIRKDAKHTMAMTSAVVETPAATLVFMCGGDQGGEGAIDGMMRLGFHVAEGALQPPDPEPDSEQQE